MQCPMAEANDSLLTIEGFIAEHPWPERLLARGKPLEWLWDFEITVPAQALWPHLIDTSRLNRALGLSKMEFVEREGVLHGESTNGGRLHRWIEEPWTWISGQTLTAVRDYQRGYAEVARVIYRVMDKRLLVYFGWIPRGVVGAMVLKVGVPPLRKAYARVLGELQAQINKPKPDAYVQKAKALDEPSLHRLAALREELRTRKVSDEILDRLCTRIESGDELELYRIQPRRIAHEWDVSEEALIEACLHATRVGLLDLSWDVICPHCRGVRDESHALAGLASDGSCDVCELNFSTDKENAVEVTFHIHSSIREVPKIYFCSAEPATKQHIKLQQLVEPGATKKLQATLPAGRYRTRLLGDRIDGYITLKESGPRQWTWKAGDVHGEVEASPNFSLELVNASDEASMFVIEDVRWADEALRPSRLFAMQEFRDLFSEEYLGSDVQVSVGEQTLLFTDMVGSTKFYRDHGDPVAFVKVKDHFDGVFEIIRINKGAVVKTIGDAVMAVFSDPLAAVESARQINLAFPLRDDDDDAIRLRVSLNSGPCIAVNLNTGIDYFGGTVNTAAKLQACAEAGEVALARSVFDAPGVESSLAETGADFEERRTDLGFGPIDYIFWRVS